MEDGRFDPSVLNNDPLRQAVHRKSYGIIRKLLSMEQVDPSCNDNEFLQFAVMHRDIQTIKWLLQDPRVDPNSSIDSVVEEGNETIISLLLQTNKLRRVELDMAVQVSVSRNFPSITKMLLPLVNPEANDHALTMAVTMETIRHRHGITAFKLFLKDERVDITCRDNILLLSAVRTRSEEMVRLLIQAGGDVNANNGEAMKTAIQDLSGGVIDVILEAKGYIPEESHLYQAILLRNTRLARKLIPLVNPGYDNNLCIKTAAKGGLTGIMEELIKDPRVDPRLAVFKATSLDILDILLSDPRVDPSIKNSRVLLFAVENGDAEMFERLFEDGRVDFSVRNNVALTTAVDLSNWGMVEKLLKVGEMFLIYLGRKS